MPRLRYLKNRNLNEQPSFVSFNYEESDDEEDFTDPSKPRKGWWATSNVVASLSESKIRQAIENYRRAISLLENELISRRVSPRKTGNTYERLDLLKTGEVVRRRMQRARTNGQSFMGVLAKQRIPKQVREEIKRQWLEILDKYNKGAI